MYNQRRVQAGQRGFEATDTRSGHDNEQINRGQFAFALQAEQAPYALIIGIEKQFDVPSICSITAFQ